MTVRTWALVALWCSLIALQAGQALCSEYKEPLDQDNGLPLAVIGSHQAAAEDNADAAQASGQTSKLAAAAPDGVTVPRKASGAPRLRQFHTDCQCGGGERQQQQLQPQLQQKRHAVSEHHDAATCALRVPMLLQLLQQARIQAPACLPEDALGSRDSGETAASHSQSMLGDRSAGRPTTAPGHIASAGTAKAVVPADEGVSPAASSRLQTFMRRTVGRLKGLLPQSLPEGSPAGRTGSSGGNGGGGGGRNCDAGGDDSTGQSVGDSLCLGGAFSLAP